MTISKKTGVLRLAHEPEADISHNALPRGMLPNNAERCHTNNVSLAVVTSRDRSREFAYISVIITNFLVKFSEVIVQRLLYPLRLSRKCCE